MVAEAASDPGKRTTPKSSEVVSARRKIDSSARVFAPESIHRCKALEWEIDGSRFSRAPGDQCRLHDRSVSPQKTAALFADPAMFPRKVHSREACADLFWPAADLESKWHSVSLAGIRSFPLLITSRVGLGVDGETEFRSIRRRLKKERPCLGIVPPLASSSRLPPRRCGH